MNKSKIIKKTLLYTPLIEDVVKDIIMEYMFPEPSVLYEQFSESVVEAKKMELLKYGVPCINRLFNNICFGNNLQDSLIIGKDVTKIFNTIIYKRGSTIVDECCVHDGYCNSVLFNRDETRSISGAFDYMIKVWKLGSTERTYSKPLMTWETTKTITTLKGHEGPVMCISLDEGDDNTLISGSRDKTIIQWDIERKKVVFQYLINDWTNSVYVKDKIYVVAGDDKIIYVFDKTVNKPVLKFKGHTDIINSVHMNDKLIVSGSNDTTICIWDIRMNMEQWKLKNYCSVSKVAITKNDELLSLGKDITLKLWK